MIDFSDKCGLLAELWINYKDDGDIKEFQEFMDYNDIGLPLAYMIANGLVNEPTPLGEQYIEETFAMLISGFDIDENDIDPDWTLEQFLKYIADKNEK